MRIVQRMVIASVLCFGLASCEEEPSQSDEVEVAAPAEAEAAPTAEQVPVPEDFADEAQREIDDGNYRDELAELETELAE